MITLGIAAMFMQNATVQGFDMQRINRIPETMRRYIEEGEMAGVVTLIQRKGQNVLFDAQGSARLNPAVPMKTDTVFQVMSMTKPIVAVAVMICAERGLLNLDDPVGRYLPGLKNPKVRSADGSVVESSKTMTIRHLLTHTSGLPSSDPGGIDDDQKALMTLESYAKLYGSDPLRSEPGTQIAYSGPGISAAGRIVEIVTGRAIQDFMREEIFAPLGMNDTSFFTEPRHADRLAFMYIRENGAWRQYQSDPSRRGAKFANPAGGLYSTAADMAKFMRCMVEDGKRVLSPRSVAVMTMVQTGNLQMDGNDAQGFGLGFSVVRSASGTQTLRPIGSFGHTGAFGTEFWADPKTGMIAVYMSQSFADRPRKTFNTMANAALIK